MKHQKAPRHMPVMQAKCKTCPFGEQGDKSVEMSVTIFAATYESADE